MDTALWAREQFGAVALGDLRLERRLEEVASCIWAGAARYFAKGRRRCKGVESRVSPVE